jgi:hypothetical protein
MLLPISGNMPNSDNMLIGKIVEMLRARLPAEWKISIKKAAKPVGNVSLALAARVSIRRGAASATLSIDAKSSIEPKDVDVLAAMRRHSREESVPLLIAARFLSPRTRERLESQGFAYADLAGNVRLTLSEPGLFVSTTGALENPSPDPRERKSLKGAKAGRLVRALCDFRPPHGLRELAKRAGVDAGYSSRIVDLLDREALITRTTRGPITNADWPNLLRRWVQEYSPFRRAGATMFLAPRGIPAVIARLKQSTMRYAVTGSWAAAEVAPVAPPRLLSVYVADDSFETIASHLDIRPADAGANVAVLTPFDEVVFERTSLKSGVTIAALSQVAADLLPSPGRAPNEGETLMQWMIENEDGWRT